MVSFTAEGGTQIMDRVFMKGILKGVSSSAANSTAIQTTTVTHKRDASGQDDLLEQEEQQPPTKRVKFADTMPHITPDTQVSSILCKQFVHAALSDWSLESKRAYQELRKKFILNPADENAPSSLELRQTMSALTHTVSRLDKGRAQLVVDIVNTTWAGRDLLFFKAYLRLLGNIVSAHSNYIPLVTKMLVQHLTLKSSRICMLPNHQPVTRQTIYDRTHESLQYIMELVPTAAHSTFFPVLVAEFPHKSENRPSHTTYLTNLLHVVHYAPALRSKILAMVMERVIKIDIEIQADIEDLTDDEGGILAYEIKNSEELDSESDVSSDDDDDDEVELSSVERIKLTVDKLDAMLEVLFDFFSPYFPNAMEARLNLPPPPQSQAMFEHLLESFDKTILPTYQSSYTQFIIFWAVQKSPMFIDIFLGELIGYATDNNKSQVLRQAAAAYVASFVARAKMMDKTSVRTVVSILCNWLNAFLLKREAECAGADIAKFGSFYSVFQAVMYIFCFRWRYLKVDEDEGEDGERKAAGARWIPGLQVMQRAIVSRFNPLKVCSHVVVDQFARIAHFLDFVYCYSVIAQNQRSVLGGDSNPGGTNSNSGAARLNPERTGLATYFPFDPYHLRRSRKWVEGYYVEWQPIPGLDPDDSDDDDDDDEDEEEDGGSSDDDDDDDNDDSKEGDIDRDSEEEEGEEE